MGRGEEKWNSKNAKKNIGIFCNQEKGGRKGRTDRTLLRLFKAIWQFQFPFSIPNQLQRKSPTTSTDIPMKRPCLSLSLSLPLFRVENPNWASSVTYKRRRMHLNFCKLPTTKNELEIFPKKNDSGLFGRWTTQSVREWIYSSALYSARRRRKSLLLKPSSFIKFPILYAFCSICTFLLRIFLCLAGFLAVAMQRFRTTSSRGAADRRTRNKSFINCSDPIGSDDDGERDREEGEAACRSVTGRNILHFSHPAAPTGEYYVGCMQQTKSSIRWGKGGQSIEIKRKESSGPLEKKRKLEVVQRQTPPKAPS